MRVRAFQGLVPSVEAVERVASVPYDVVNRDEAAALAEGNAESFLRVVRAEIDFPPEQDPYSDAVYARAAENLKRLQDSGALVREGTPAIYLYRQVMGEQSQVGIVAACHVDDYGEDIIRKHEKTRQVKEDDRTRLVGDLSAHPGPVFLTYKDHDALNAKVASIVANEVPLFDFVADDGVGHTVWRVTDTGEFEGWFDDVPLSYVADGHHRSASAYRVGKERQAANPNHDGSEDYNWFLGVLFPASHLKILSYNRAVHDLDGLSAGELLAKIRGCVTVEETDGKEPESAGSACMYLEGKWYRLSWDATAEADPVESLDVSVLQNRILAPFLGIDDPRTSERIDFVGGIRGTAELERMVDSGAAGVAFSLYPVTVEQLMAIADAGQIMPPKSTWFEPKLRSGLVVYTFETA
jgi:uncharacterized protein (DUF1015 family)